MVKSKGKTVLERNPPSEEESDEEPETYEVEKIVGYRCHRGVEQYRIKWEGYPEEDNTWEPVENIHATDLIQEYWKSQANQGPSKTGTVARSQIAAAKAAAQGGKDGSNSADDNEPERPVPKQTKRKPLRTTVESDDPKGKRPKYEPNGESASTPAKDEDEDDVRVYDQEVELDPEIANAESWEDLVAEVETIEQGHTESELVVFILWKDGRRSMHSSVVANKKCPQAMISFYESHIRFRRPEDGDEGQTAAAASSEEKSENDEPLFQDFNDGDDVVEETPEDIDEIRLE
ncbi:uncharacterized protein SPPG_06938 [Spizellomyces punctatus DAOM BR117]|uniref:Chromo domain-containing protein n=1 Tax=Spizellomyces punctatus (strain DAOM BR117) TaxID=645134 RepID=A0A0L0H8T5_SPIPD|nr:uncharacterized protein SPPG_06938 [Spizellomyces punctatus DAOM BR117]KNC97950.1 hypothetical protein SPPG_06938 [Spizellomyces punctatus DAOM BR117]|eukprot:XP_016605990.1 hypothetical protein SPPG_06938 [Spizellomyces punctatus DAOM BR117]